MPLDREQLEQIIDRPAESLSLELKSWFDPNANEGISKLVKACCALRNQDGGHLLIGFNNADGSVETADAPQDVEQLFHVDNIQQHITRFSSEPFEIFIYYPEVEDIRVVVIEIPQGIKSPVAMKSDLVGAERNFINIHDVYVRTLNANNTPSTAKAKWQDWPALVERCFENREADVGRFIRRHLSSASGDQLKDVFLKFFTNIREDSGNGDDDIVNFLSESTQRYQQVAAEKNIDIPEHGSMEVAVIVRSEIDEMGVNQDFLNLLMSSNPRYTGWPVWTDSRGFRDEESRPRVSDGFWEAFIASFENDFSDHLDFWRLSPVGKFYLYRAFQDDIGASERAPERGTALDFGLSILRAAECIVVASVFARALGASEEDSIQLIFRWSGLQNRSLSSWANPDRMLSYDRQAYQDEVVTKITIPIDTALGAYSGYTHQVVSKLFEAFEGFVLSEKVTDDLVRRLLERRL